MCCDTKQKIAMALRELMNERPLRKITVQDLMERTQMKRQSFYYHFRDIRDVIEWICRQQLSVPLMESDLDFEAWVIYALELLNEDRVFYRKVLLDSNPEDLNRFCMSFLLPRMTQVLFGTADQQMLTSDQLFVAEYECQSLLFHFASFLYNRRVLDVKEATSRIRCLMSYRKQDILFKAIS